MDSGALSINFRIQDGRQSAILGPTTSNIKHHLDVMVINNISEFDINLPKIVDSGAISINFKIQDGCQSAILGPTTCDIKH